MGSDRVVPSALPAHFADIPVSHESDGSEREAAGLAPALGSALAGPGGVMPESLSGAFMTSEGGLIPASLRQGLGGVLGPGLSGVRLHTDSVAARAAAGLDAAAFTHGRDIWFGVGQLDTRSPQGRALLAHELIHAARHAQLGIIHRQPADANAAARTPSDEIDVTVVEVSRSESDLLFHDYGIRLPGSPPRVQFGADGPIPQGDQNAVQLAFDLAYTTAASPSFAAKFGEFKGSIGEQEKANIPGLADLSQQKYLTALSRMKINLADTSNNAPVKDLIRKESQSKGTLPTAGFTPVGSSDVYIRKFALTEGRDALASLILHESVHVAGLPAKPINEFLESIMEVSIHGFEASVGLPLSQVVEQAGAIRGVKPHGQGVEFEVSITKPDDLPSNTIQVEIFDGNRQRVFSVQLPRAKFARKFTWNGLNASGAATESGIHSMRVVAGSVLVASYDYVLRRGQK